MVSLGFWGGPSALDVMFWDKDVCSGEVGLGVLGGSQAGILLDIYRLGVY